MKTAESHNAPLTGKIEVLLPKGVGLKFDEKNVVECIPRLKWTKEKPTGQGFYWFRGKWRSEEGDFELGEVVEVSARLVVYIFHYEGGINIDRLEGEWAGPIEEPK